MVLLPLKAGVLPLSLALLRVIIPGTGKDDGLPTEAMGDLGLGLLVGAGIHVTRIEEGEMEQIVAMTTTVQAALDGMVADLQNSASEARPVVVAEVPARGVLVSMIPVLRNGLNMTGPFPRVISVSTAAPCLLVVLRKLGSLSHITLSAC